MDEKGTYALACMMLTGIMVPASAADSDQEVRGQNEIAYLDFDEASPDFLRCFLIGMRLPGKLQKIK